MFKEEPEVGGGVEVLQTRIQELQQKLVMAEQAVNDKEEEIKDLRRTLDDAKEDANSDLQQEMQAWSEMDRVSNKEIAKLKEQIKDLGGYVNECKEALAQQEIKSRNGRTTERGDVKREVRS